ncbi:MAG: type II secretion system protein [Herminiimonas sp.]|uniref:type II secretion system protein n=1 Tax=Herminiimonas sp. TaxID=1926289 RepID=UPI002726153E|nr:type II secretion system protein [Herminiimonas sp.]MDO9421462.1 type II secretion system protein [Herminiimonas sp.]
MAHDTKRSSQGFTLAEMAIVVLLVGILLTFGVGLVQSQLENSAINVTKKRQEAIRDALIGYLGKYHRLPCPESAITPPPAPNVSFDGIEDRAGGTAGTPPVPNPATQCVVTFGTLPFVTLGLSREMALDGWNNFFTYQVSNTPYDWTRSASFNTGNQGGIVVNDRPNISLVPYPIPAVVVLVSHGKNGAGAFTIKGTRNTLPIAADIDQLDNTSNDGVFVRRELTNSDTAPGGTFDDIVAVFLPSDLVTTTVQNKSTLSFDEQVSQANKDIENIQLALIGYVIRNNRLPFADSNNDGLEDSGAFTGNIPWQTLGVAANDPWAISSPPAAVAVANRYRYRVTPALTATTSKADFITQVGNIVVNDGTGTILTSTAPFVVYSRGRNNVAFFNNGAGNGAPCTAAAPSTPLAPVAPNCLGTNEINNFAGNAPFVKAAMNLPPFFTTNFPPTAGYDDIVEFVAKGAIDARLP